MLLRGRSVLISVLVSSLCATLFFIDLELKSIIIIIINYYLLSFFVFAYVLCNLWHKILINKRLIKVCPVLNKVKSATV